MSEKHVAEIERLLKIAEDELSYVQRQFLLDQIASLKRERENLLQPMVEEWPAHYSAGSITSQSGKEAKIRLFRSLFRGREDVYARRFENRRTGKSGYYPDCGNERLATLCPKPMIGVNYIDRRRQLH